MKKLEDRIQEAVAKRLETDVVFIEWHRNPNGSDTPVVRVPKYKMREARSLGIRIEERPC